MRLSGAGTFSEGLRSHSTHQSLLSTHQQGLAWVVRSAKKTQITAPTLRYLLNLQQLTHTPAQGDRQWISISLMRLLSGGSQLVGWARWRPDGDRRDIRILR